MGSVFTTTINALKQTLGSNELKSQSLPLLRNLHEVCVLEGVWVKELKTRVISFGPGQKQGMLGVTPWGNAISHKVHTADVP